MNEKELAIELEKWFNTTNKRDKNFWNRSPVAKIIKDKLTNMGHFKQLVGGDPSKAKRKMDWVLACRNGYEGEFEG